MTVADTDKQMALSFMTRGGNALSEENPLMHLNHENSTHMKHVLIACAYCMYHHTEAMCLSHVLMHVPSHRGNVLIACANACTTTQRQCAYRMCLLHVPPHRGNVLIACAYCMYHHTEAMCLSHVLIACTITQRQCAYRMYNHVFLQLTPVA